MSFSSLNGSGLPLHVSSLVFPSGTQTEPYISATAQVGTYTQNLSSQAVNTNTSTVAPTTTNITSVTPNNLVNGITYIEDWIIIVQNTSIGAGTLSVLQSETILGNAYIQSSIPIPAGSYYQFNTSYIKSYNSTPQPANLTLPLVFVDATNNAAYSVKFVTVALKPTSLV